MQWFPSPGCTQFPGSAGRAQGPEGETDLEWPGSREVEAPSNVRPRRGVSQLHCHYTTYFADKGSEVLKPLTALDMGKKCACFSLCAFDTLMTPQHSAILQKGN